MPKILIVEDDDNKLQRIERFAVEKFTDYQIDVARSLHGGLKKVITDKFDFVLLDMTLPHFDVGPDESGGAHHIFGGVEFIRQVRRRGVNSRIIVVTQFETFGRPPEIISFEELRRLLIKDGGEGFLGLVYYHASRNDWQLEIIKLIEDEL